MNESVVAGYEKKPPPSYPGSVSGAPPSFHTIANDPPPSLSTAVEFGVFPDYRATRKSVLVFHPFSQSASPQAVIYKGNGHPLCSVKQGFLSRDTMKFISPEGKTIATLKRQARYPSFWSFAMFDTAGSRIGHVHAQIQGQLGIDISLEFRNRYDTHAVTETKLCIKTGIDTDKPSVAVLGDDSIVALYNKVPKRGRLFNATHGPGADLLLMAMISVAASASVPDLLNEIADRIDWVKKYGGEYRERGKPASQEVFPTAAFDVTAYRGRKRTGARGGGSSYSYGGGFFGGGGGGFFGDGGGGGGSCGDGGGGGGGGGDGGGGGGGGC